MNPHLSGRAIDRGDRSSDGLVVTADLSNLAIHSRDGQMAYNSARSGLARADVADLGFPSASSVFGNGGEASALAPAIAVASDTAANSGGLNDATVVANAQSFSLYDRQVPTTVGLDTKVAVPDSNDDAGNSSVVTDAGHSPEHHGHDYIEPVEPARPINTIPDTTSQTVGHPLHLSPRAEMG